MHIPPFNIAPKDESNSNNGQNSVNIPAELFFRLIENLNAREEKLTKELKEVTELKQSLLNYGQGLQNRNISIYPKENIITISSKQLPVEAKFVQLELKEKHENHWKSYNNTDFIDLYAEERAIILRNCHRILPGCVIKASDDKDFGKVTIAEYSGDKTEQYQSILNLLNHLPDSPIRLTVTSKIVENNDYLDHIGNLPPNCFFDQELLEDENLYIRCLATQSYMDKLVEIIEKCECLQKIEIPDTRQKTLAYRDTRRVIVNNAGALPSDFKAFTTELEKEFSCSIKQIVQGKPKNITISLNKTGLSPNSFDVICHITSGNIYDVKKRLLEWAPVSKSIKLDNLNKLKFAKANLEKWSYEGSDYSVKVYVFDNELRLYSLKAQNLNEYLDIISKEVESIKETSSFKIKDEFNQWHLKFNSYIQNRLQDVQLWYNHYIWEYKIDSNDSKKLQEASEYIKKFDDSLVQKTVSLTIDKLCKAFFEQNYKDTDKPILSLIKAAIPTTQKIAYDIICTGPLEYVKTHELELMRYEKSHCEKINIVSTYRENIPLWKEELNKKGMELHVKDSYLFLNGLDRKTVETSAKNLRDRMTPNRKNYLEDIHTVWFKLISADKEFLAKCEKISPTVNVTLSNNQICFLGQTEHIEKSKLFYRDYMSKLINGTPAVKYRIDKNFAFLLTHDAKKDMVAIQEKYGITILGITATPYKKILTLKNNDVLIRLNMGDIAWNGNHIVCAHEVKSAQFYGDAYSIMEREGDEGKKEAISKINKVKPGNLFTNKNIERTVVHHVVYDDLTLANPTVMIQNILNAADVKGNEHIAIPPIGADRYNALEILPRLTDALLECLANQKPAHLKEIHFVCYDAEVAKIWSDIIANKLPAKMNCVNYNTETTYNLQPLKDPNKRYLYLFNGKPRGFSPIVNNQICWNIEKGARDFKIKVEEKMIDFDPSLFQCVSIDEFQEKKYVQDKDQPFDPDSFEVEIVGKEPHKAIEALNEVLTNYSKSIEIDSISIEQAERLAKQFKVKYEISDLKTKKIKFIGFKNNISDLLFELKNINNHSLL